jgi:outer membrane biosynthesis protein TonB
MEASRKQRRQQLQSVLEPGFSRMLLISLLLHFLLPILYYSPLFPEREVEKPLVYRVNLVNKIVKNPQAGRPEASTEKIKTEPKPEVKVQPKPVTPKPEPAAVKIPAKETPKPVVKPEPKTEEKVIKPEPKPEPKPVEKVVKPEPKPQPTGPTKAAEESLQQRLAKMKAEAEKRAREEERQQYLDSLRAAVKSETAQIESPVSDAPVGEIGGKGNEAGVSAKGYVQEFIQQQWSFSKYQAIGNPEAELILRYSQSGVLLHYKFVKKSGNQAFDESLTRVIAKVRQLPQELPQAEEFHIIFNLKDMLDRQ